MWHSMLRCLSNGRQHPVDKSREAQLTLKIAIDEVGMEESRLKEDLRRIASDVRASHKSQLTQTTKQLLLSSRGKRMTLASVQRKRMALEKHQETLQSCELNEKVLSSMKKTSGVLKDIGMEAQMQDLDETMMDLQEGTQNASMFSTTLSESLGGEDDNDDLAAELEALMNDDYSSVLCRPPPVQNSTGAGKDAAKNAAKDAAKDVTKAPASVASGAAEAITESKEAVTETPVESEQAVAG